MNFEKNLKEMFVSMEIELTKSIEYLTKIKVKFDFN